MHVKYRGSLPRLLAVLLLPVALTLSGCHTQAEAVAAAQQMATTSATLQIYYRSLSGLVARTEEAQAAQSYLSGIPFDDETRKQLEDTRGEMKKRAEMAGTFTRLSALFADITRSGAAADAAKAANDLNTELIAIKAIKTNSQETEALKVAVTAVVNIVKMHDEIKAARLIKPLATTLSAFFDSERDQYQSIADSYYLTAASNSGALIDKDQVATGLLYRSSLQPFGLSPAITDQALRKTSQGDLKARVADRLADHQHGDMTAATALSESLHVMRDRVATVADGKPMKATLPPLTLEGVKEWIEDVRSDIGEQ